MDKNLKSSILILIILLSLNRLSFAADNAISFLDKGLGARPLALGGAYTAIGEGVDAIFYNPAGLALEKKALFAGSSASFFSEINYSASSLVLPSLGGTLGISFSQGGIEGIPKASLGETGRPVIESYFSENKTSFLLSYAKTLKSDLFIGANLKSLNHNLYNASANGLGLDLGALYLPSTLPLRLGINIRNLTNTKMQWSTGNIDTLPRELNFGLAYQGKLFAKDLLFSLDALLKDKQVTRFAYGAEYQLFPSLFALRAGVNPEEITTGIGLNLKNFSLDYAYLQHQELGISSRVSLGITLK